MTQKKPTINERVSLLFIVDRDRFRRLANALSSILDLDVAASRRASQAEDEVAQREVFVASLRQANAAVDRARLCREVRQSVCEAEIRPELLLIDDEARRRVRAVVVDRDEFELIVADVLGPRSARRS